MAAQPGDVDPVIANMSSLVDGEWGLFVAGHTYPAGTYVGLVREAFDGLPSRLDVVELGNEGPTVDAGSLPPAVTVRSEAPGDLTAVDVHANEFLTRSRDADGPAIVWYDSITHALAHADRSELFRSLHRLSVRTRGVGGTGYYWLSPEEHDDRTRAVFGSLFDAVVSSGRDE